MAAPLLGGGGGRGLGAADPGLVPEPLEEMRRRAGYPGAPPGEIPTIGRFVTDMTRLVGFRPSKRQPLPGAQLIWKGLNNFIPQAVMWRHVRENYDIRPKGATTSGGIRDPVT